MPEPGFIKAWEFNVNNKITWIGQGFTERQVLRKIKDSLIGFPTTPWQIVSCSDSVSVNTSGTDLWTDDSKLVWGNTGVAHSWMVLRNPNLEANFQLLIECARKIPNGQGGDSFEGAIRMIRSYISPSVGFTGGTTTTPPDATDKLFLKDGTTYSFNNPWGSASWGVANALNSDVYLHCMKSTDGECTRVFIYSKLPFSTGNVCHGMWLFEKARSPNPAWTSPIFYAMHGSHSNSSDFNAPIYTYLTDGHYTRGVFPGVDGMSVAFGGEGYGGNLLVRNLNIASDFTWEWPIYPISLIGVSVGNRAHLGFTYDMYWGASGRNAGDTYPGTLPRKWVQFGNLIVPWSQIAGRPILQT